MSGVTGASVLLSSFLNECDTVSSVSDTTVIYTETLDPFGCTGFSGSVHAFQVISSSTTVGTIQYSIQTDVGTFTGTTSGPVAQQSVALLDPVPSLLSGPAVTTDTDLLAIGGRPVVGVAADGVTEIVLRIPNYSGEQFSARVMNDQDVQSTSTDEDGALAPVGGTTFESSANFSAVSTTSGTMAFVIYRAPVDFPRISGQDVALVRRFVSIEVRSNDVAGSAFNVPVEILRPPVVLIHGLWSDPGAWDFFDPLSCKQPTATCPDLRFQVFKVDYSKTNASGFLLNAAIAQSQLVGSTRSIINTFKLHNSIAAVQSDIVAHSMGGDIARTMVIRPGFLRNNNYLLGDIHKLITLDTPHLGSEFATRLQQQSGICKVLFDKAGYSATQGAIAGSDARRRLIASALISSMNWYQCASSPRCS